MLLSPSRADCIIFELESVLVAVDEGAPSAAPDGSAGQASPGASLPSGVVAALFNARWDKLPLPVGVIAADKNVLAEGLTVIGWQDLPRSRSAVIAAAGNSLESLCRDLGSQIPLVIGSSSALFDLFTRLGRGDFVTVGKGIPQCPIRFTTAADALRAIFGVV